MKLATQVQVLDKVVYILHHANALGNGMNPYILPTIVEQTGCFSLDKATWLGEGKLRIQTNCTLLRKIDLLLHHAHVGGVR